MNLSGNTVLITGGATGIGYAMAEAFLEAGSEVLICGRRATRLREAQKIHPQLHTKVCNVADDKDRRALFEWATSNFGKLNVLVNNAGIQRDIDLTGGIYEITSGESEIKVNLEAPIYLSAMFIPFLLKQKNAAIINVSSGLGFVPAAKMPIYSATKAGVHAYSMVLRQQLLKTSIKVYEVIPPTVDSELNKEGRAKRKMPAPDLKPKEFVAAVMKGLQKDESEIGYGMTAGFKAASRADLDKSFQMMNSRM
jgi:uncharacterized oxidoreductase